VSRINERHEHVMTTKDQDVAQELKNEFLDLCLKRKVTSLVALAAARCAAECFESIINEQGGQVFTVPTTPAAGGERCAECVRCGHSNVDRHGECRQCIDWLRHVCVFGNVFCRHCGKQIKYEKDWVHVSDNLAICCGEKGGLYRAEPDYERQSDTAKDALPAPIEAAQPAGEAATSARMIWKDIPPCHHSRRMPQCMSCLLGHASLMEIQTQELDAENVRLTAEVERLRFVGENIVNDNKQLVEQLNQAYQQRFAAQQETATARADAIGECERAVKAVIKGWQSDVDQSWDERPDLSFEAADKVAGANEIAAALAALREKGGSDGAAMMKEDD
jgi:hypothetical protein